MIIYGMNAGVDYKDCNYIINDRQFEAIKSSLIASHWTGICLNLDWDYVDDSAADSRDQSNNFIGLKDTCHSLSSFLGLSQIKQRPVFTL